MTEAVFELTNLSGKGRESADSRVAAGMQSSALLNADSMSAKCLHGLPIVRERLGMENMTIKTID